MGISIAKHMAVALFCIVAVWSCRGIDSDDGIGDDQGELSVWIADGPVEDADRVEVTITGVAVQPADDDLIEIDADRPITVDLLDLGDLDDPRERLISDHSLPVGDYEAIQLLVDETRLFIEVDGRQLPLTIPDDQLDGLELPVNVRIEDDTDLDVTIDWDLRKSLRQRGEDDYVLHPALRAVRSGESGHLEGQVAEEWVDNPECGDRDGLNREGNAVYVFSGGNATFQDLQGNDSDPLATSVVEFDAVESTHHYRVKFLRRGDYTAVFTCDAALDDPDGDDEFQMFFSDPINVTIEPESTATADFEASDSGGLSVNNSAR